MKSLPAVALGLLWCIQNVNVEKPEIERIALLVIGVALLALGLRWPIAPFAALYAVAIAIPERLGRELVNTSDVGRATNEALDVVLAGGNPYAHIMQSTNPIGSPFVYPPGEFFFYLPAKLLTGDIARVDTWAGIGIVALIAFAGFRVGFDRAALPAMLYATWGIAGWHTVGGANDVAASFMVVLALVALVFAVPSRAGGVAFILSAVALGWAVAFKQFAVLLVPPILRWLAVSGAPWRIYAAVAGATSAAFVLPFAVREPNVFVAQQLAALTFHKNIWGENVLAALRPFTDPESMASLAKVLTVVVLIVMLLVLARWRIPSIGAAAIVGVVAVMCALLLARWTAQPYYVYAGAIVAAGLALMRPASEAAPPGGPSAIAKA